MPWAWPSCPTTRPSAPRPRRRIERDRRRGGPAGPRLARRARRRRPRRPGRPRVHAVLPPAVRRRPTAGAWPASSLDRLAFCLRKRAEHEAEVYFPSLSARTARLQGHADHRAARAVLPRPVRPRASRPSSRWCTRASRPTPSRSWPLAHPYRLIAHNGEINTVKGNRNWMRARESQLRLRRHPRRPRAALPDLHPGRLRLGVLRRGARAAAPRRPLAAARGADDDPGGLGEPRVDGPRPPGVLRVPLDLHGAVGRPGVRHLHRRHAHRRRPRPQRPAPGPLLRSPTTGSSCSPPRPACSTSSPSSVVRAGRLQPGRMFLVDTEHGRIVGDEEVKSSARRPEPLRGVAARRPASHLDDLPEREHIVHTAASVARRQHTFGYTAGGAEDPARARWPAPAARPSARWAPTPRSLCSPSGRGCVFDYFTQLFAQVTNPPLDAIREELVTSLGTTIGPEGNALAAIAGPRPPGRAAVPGHRQRRARQDRPHQRRRRPARLRHRTWCAGSTTSPGAQTAMQARLEEIFAEVSEAIAEGARFVVLSDRDSGRDLAPIPSLLLTSAVHHHLIREKTRTRVGLLVEAGDVREVHHVALLVGYGAAAVNPYLAMESVEDLVRSGAITGVTDGEGGRQPHQGARQGRPQGHVQDGHLHRRLLPRRPGVRGDRPVAGARRPLLHRHRQPARRGRASTSSPRRPRPGTPRPTRRTASACRTASSRSAASTSGAARASRTCSTPTRSSGCSTPPGPGATTSSSSTPSASTSSPSA